MIHSRLSFPVILFAAASVLPVSSARAAQKEAERERHVVQNEGGDSSLTERDREREHHENSDKLKIDSVSHSPEPFSVPVHGSLGITAKFDARPTDGGVGANGDVARNGKTFAIRVAVTLSPDGKVVGTEPKEFPVKFPTDLPASKYLSVTCPLTWDGRDENGAAFPDGKYTYSVQGTLVRYDVLGNGKPQEHVVATSASLSGTVVIDSTPPVGAPVSPAPGTWINEARPEVVATFADGLAGLDVESASLDVNGHDVDATFDEETKRVTGTPTTDLPEAEITAVAGMTDLAGNMGTIPWTFSVDLTPPAASDPSPADETWTNDTTPEISVSLVDALSGVNPASIILEVDGSPVEDPGFVDGRVIHTPGTALSEGYVEVSVNGSDAVGNSMPEPFAWTFGVDTTPATVSIASPSAYTKEVRPLVTVDATDALSGVDEETLVVKLDGTTIGTGTEGYSSSPDWDLQEGEHTVSVEVSDSAGNPLPEPKEFTFTVDLTPPHVEINSPADGAACKSLRPTISANVTDVGSGLSGTTVGLLLDSPDNVFDVAIDPSGDFSWTPGVDLAAGEHNVAVIATDAVGNSTSGMPEASWSFFVVGDEIDIGTDGLGTVAEAIGAIAAATGGAPFQEEWTISLPTGDYAEEVSVGASVAPTAAHPLTIRAEGEVVFDGDGELASGFIVTADNVHLVGLTVQDYTGSGVVCDGAHGFVVSGITSSSNGAWGIWVSSPDADIVGCMTGGNATGGIYVYSSASQTIHLWQCGIGEVDVGVMVEADAGGSAQLVNNTIVVSAGNALVFGPQADGGNVMLRNNILRAGSFPLYFDSALGVDYAAGLAAFLTLDSDHNDLFPTVAGADAAGWNGGSCSFDDWQISTGHEQNGLSAEPHVVDPMGGDFHLRSFSGRYTATGWVSDPLDQHSPCIDAGVEMAAFDVVVSNEPEPNGGIANIGRHGGTEWASMSAPADAEPPAAPTGLAVTSATTTHVYLVWDANVEPDFEHYDVYRDTTPGFTPSDANRIADNVTVDFHFDSSVAASTTYYYVVTATDSSQNESAPSVEATAIAELTSPLTVGPGGPAQGYGFESIQDAIDALNCQLDGADFEQTWEIRASGFFYESVSIPSGLRPLPENRLVLRGSPWAVLDGSNAEEYGIHFPYATGNTSIIDFEVRNFTECGVYVDNVGESGQGYLLERVHSHHNANGISCLYGTGQVVECVTDSNAGSGISAHGSVLKGTWTVRDCLSENNLFGLAMSGPHTVLSNEVRYCFRGLELRANGGTMTVTGNTLMENESAELLNVTKYGGKLEFRNNFVLDTWFACTVYTWQKPCEVVFENNTFWSSDWMTISWADPQSSAATAKITVRNNIFSCGGQGKMEFGYSFVPVWESVDLSSDYNAWHGNFTFKTHTQKGPRTYSLSQWRTLGYDQNSIAVDPLFANPEAGDFHLKSQTGRWSPAGGGTWVVDGVTSPCIDAGDPALAVGDEKPGNGGRINMGAYGGTRFASRSGFPPVPGGFSLLSPHDGEQEVAPTTTLDWEDAPFADTYAVTVSPDNGFATLVVDQTGLVDSDFAIPPGVLEPLTDYYWKVIASNMTGSTECQQSFGFMTTDWSGGGTPGGLTVTISTTPAIDPAKPFTDDRTLDTVTVTVGSGTAPYTVTLTGAGAKTQASPVTFTDVPLVEGQNTLVATATDANGDFGQATLMVFLDTTPPEVEILAPHRIASGHLRDADGRPVLVAGPSDIEPVYDTDSPVSHRTKRNVIGFGTSWLIRTDEDLAPIESAQIISVAADPDTGNPVPPLPPSAWDYLNMPLEAHPSAGTPPEDPGTTQRTFYLAPGTHTVTSPLSTLAEGQYWIIAEVENAAGGKTRVGGLVYVDATAPESVSAYSGDPDAVELKVDGSAENVYGYADRNAGTPVPRWTLHPQLVFEEPPDYGGNNVGLSEPDPVTVTLDAWDYAGNHRNWDYDASCAWAADEFRALSSFGEENCYVGFENSWVYSYDIAESCDGNGFLHFTEGGSFDFTYEVLPGVVWDFWGDMLPGTIGVRIDGVVSPSGVGIVPAPPVWPLEGAVPETVEVSLVGDFLYCGLSDPSGGMGWLSLGSSDYPAHGPMPVASNGQCTAAGDGSGPDGQDIVAFEGEWVLGDYYTDDTIHRQVAGWESVYAEFWGYSEGNEIDVYLDTTRPGMLNVVRAGPSVMATGTRTTLRIVAGGLENLSVSDLASETNVNVWLRKDGETIDPGPDTYSRATDDAGTVIPARVVTFDLANARRYKALEIDLDLSPDLPVGVYDVEVKAGSVIAVDPQNRNASDYPVGDHWYGDHDGLVVERAVNILKIEDLGILQAEVLHKADWVQVADQIDTSNWAIEVGADQTAIVLLDPEQAAPTPLAEIPGAGIGKKRYPFSKSLKVLGIAQDEAIIDIDVVMGATRLAGHIVVTPIVMSQSVEPPSYGTEAFPAQPYGLLGHAGRLEPLLDDNDLTNRDMDFQRFAWQSIPEVAEDGTQRVAVFCKGEVAGDGKVAVRIHGWRPGLTTIKATLKDNSSIEIGEWETVCEFPSVHLPHPGQMDRVYRFGPIDEEMSIDEPDQLPQVLLDGDLASYDIRLLMAHHMRGQYAYNQIARRQRDETPLMNQRIFAWPSVSGSSFTFVQALTILARGIVLPLDDSKAPFLRLFDRLDAYASDQDFVAINGSNQDCLVPLRVLARNYLDGALQSILKMGVSLCWSPTEYAERVLSHAEDKTQPDYAPGHNMLRTGWDSPAWYEPDFYTSARLVDLFEDSGAPDWKLSHPYTRDVLKHMIAQRIDLARNEAWALWGQNSKSWLIGKSIEEINNDIGATSNLVVLAKTSLTETYYLKVKVYDDLSWRTEWRPKFGSSGLYVYFEGDSIFMPEQGNAVYVSAYGGWGESFRRDMQAWGYYLDSFDQSFMPSDALGGAAQEAWYLSDIMASLDEYNGWQEWQGALGGWWGDEDGTISVCALWLGAVIFGIDNMYQAWFGNDFVTEEKLMLSERLMSAGFALLDIVDLAVPVVEGATRVVKGAGRQAAKKYGREMAEEVGETWISRQARDFAGDVTDLDLGTDALERLTKETLTETDDIAKRLTRDSATDILDLDISARLAGKNESSMVGHALSDYSAHMVPDVAASVSRQRPLRELAEWSRKVKKELVAADPAYWTNGRLRDFVRNACFVAGTPVRMADGTLKSIESIRPGDWVLSRNQDGTGGLVPSQVARTFSRRVDHLRVIRIRQTRPMGRTRERSARRSLARSDGHEGEDGDPDGPTTIVYTTDDHPFWVEGAGWVAASLLGSESGLAGAGGTLRCSSALRETVPGGVVVYNFEVARTHTYFVGACSVWVHNDCKRYDEFLEFLRRAGDAHPFTRYAGQAIPNAAKKRVYLEEVIGGRFQGWSRDSFRRNLMTLTEKKADDIAGMAGHHVFPAQFKDDFARIGIHVHDPKYGVWWESVEHGGTWYEYNSRWADYFEVFQPTSSEEVKSFARELAEEFGYLDQLGF
ncbi:MAG: right-handed parallel beta-helix repeat-containing protein [Planctomycetota bacterium]|jgi:hypothetical protein